MQYIQFCQVPTLVGFPASVNPQQLISCPTEDKKLSIVKMKAWADFWLARDSGRKQYTGWVNSLQAKFSNVLCGGP